MVGVGLRLIQDVGKHRKRVYNSMDLAEAEQWRRTFWFDRFSSLNFRMITLSSIGFLLSWTD